MCLSVCRSVCLSLNYVMFYLFPCLLVFFWFVCGFVCFCLFACLVGLFGCFVCLLAFLLACLVVRLSVYCLFDCLFCLFACFLVGLFLKRTINVKFAAGAFCRGRCIALLERVGELLGVVGRYFSAPTS